MEILWRSTMTVMTVEQKCPAWDSLMPKLFNLEKEVKLENGGTNPGFENCSDSRQFFF